MLVTKLPMVPITTHCSLDICHTWLRSVHVCALSTNKSESLYLLAFGYTQICTYVVCGIFASHLLLLPARVPEKWFPTMLEYVVGNHFSVSP